MAQNFVEGVIYEIRQGPQKFDWFVRFVDDSSPSSGYIRLELYNRKSRRKQTIRIELISLMKIQSSDQVFRRYNNKLDIPRIDLFVEELGLHDHWTDSYWYFRCKTPGQLAEGIYSTQTRKGFMKVYAKAHDANRLVKQLKYADEERELNLVAPI